MSATDPSFTTHLPTLVVGGNGTAAQQLAEQLRCSGFQTDVVSNCSAVQTAVRATRYGSLVAMANPNLAADLHCLDLLRAKTRSTWIVAISSITHPKAEEVFFQHDVDSVLVAPFSVEDLTFRLWALSRRSRPP